MDNYHEDENSKIHALDEFFIDKQEKVKLVPAMERKVGDFHVHCETLAAKVAELSKPKGKTDAKNAAEEVLETILLRIRSHLRSVLRKKRDLENYAKVDLSNSEIRTMRDTDLKAFAGQVYNLATDNAEALVEFNVTAERLAAFKAAIDDYSTKLGRSLAGVGEAKEARKAAFRLMDEAEEMLDDIDDTIVAYEETDLEFYKQYMALRPTKSLGVRHRKDDTGEDGSGSQPAT